MPKKKIVLFGDNTLLHCPTNPTIDMLPYLGEHSPNNKMLYNGTECLLSLFRVEQLPSLCPKANDPIIFFPSALSAKSNFNVFQSAKEHYMRMMPVPSFVAMLCRLLCSKGYHAEFVGSELVDTTITFGTEDNRYKGLIHSLDVIFKEKDITGNLRQFLTKSVANKAREKLKELNRMGNDDQAVIERIKQVIFARLPELENKDEALKEVKIIYIDSDRVKGTSFKEWRKKAGCPEVDSIFIPLEQQDLLKNPYRHFYYALEAAFLTHSIDTDEKYAAAQAISSAEKLDALTQLCRAVDNPSVGLVDFGKEAVDEFKRRVLGARLYCSTHKFAGSIAQDCNKPKLINRKNPLSTIVAAPDSTVLAVGYGGVIYLHRFLVGANAIPVPIKDHPETMCFNHAGDALFVAGKELHIIDVTTGKITNKLPLKLNKNERILKMNVDTSQGLHLILHQKPAKKDKNHYLQSLYYPFPYDFSQQRAVEKDRVIFNRPYKQDEFNGQITSLAMHDDVTGGAEKHYLYGILAQSDAKDVRDNHMLAVCRPKVVTPVVTELAGASSLVSAFDPVNFSLQMDSPYLITAAPFIVQQGNGARIAGFCLAFVNHDHQLFVYKIDLSAKDNKQTSSDMLFSTKAENIVTAINFTPNARYFLFHTMNKGSETVGRLHIVPVPDIGTRRGVAIDPTVRQTTCGRPYLLTSIKAEDRVTPIAMMYTADNKVETLHIK